MSKRFRSVYDPGDALINARFPITAPDIATGAVEDTKIATGAVTTAKIGTDAVTTVKLATDAVTQPKAATGVVDGDTITGAVFQTATSGQRIVIDGVNDVISFFSGLSGETEGIVDPSAVSGIGALTMRPPKTTTNPRRPYIQMRSASGVASDSGGRVDIQADQFSIVMGGASHLSVNGSLDVTGAIDVGDLIASGPAWADWAPTVTSGSGTLTTKSGLGRWFQLGKTVHFQATITVTTAGTGAGGLNFTLPAAPRSPMGSDYIGEGRESAATGVALTIMSIGGSVGQILRYDNATIIASGRTCHVKGSYEAA